MRNKFIKSFRSFLISTSLCIMFNMSTSAQSTLVVGGINTTNLISSPEILRVILSQSLVKHTDYILLDRFDVAEKINKDSLDNCMGTQCLLNLGKVLNAQYALSASYESAEDRMIITLKLVDVVNGQVIKNEIRQFENQEDELIKITDLMVNYLMDKALDEIDEKTLVYKNLPANSMSLQKLDNSGPRMGFAYVDGLNGDYLTREAAQGGLGGTPWTYNIGYQFEKQYIGNENFSGIFEFIFNFAGLERGKIFPSLALLHGVRFGKGAWEIAFGPSLTTRKLSKVVTLNGKYYTPRQFSEYNNTLDSASMLDFASYPEMKIPHEDGNIEFGTNFVVGIGKTFRSGSINIPINTYISMSKYGTSYGLSVGMNIMRNKEVQKKAAQARYEKSKATERYERASSNNNEEPIIIIKQ